MISSMTNARICTLTLLTTVEILKLWILTSIITTTSRSSNHSIKVSLLSLTIVIKTRTTTFKGVAAMRTTKVTTNSSRTRLQGSIITLVVDQTLAKIITTRIRNSHSDLTINSTGRKNKLRIWDRPTTEVMIYPFPLFTVFQIDIYFLNLLMNEQYEIWLTLLWEYLQTSLM